MRADASWAGAVGIFVGEHEVGEERALGEADAVELAPHDNARVRRHESGVNGCDGSFARKNSFASDEESTVASLRPSHAFEQHVASPRLHGYEHVVDDASARRSHSRSRRHALREGALTRFSRHAEPTIRVRRGSPRPAARRESESRRRPRTVGVSERSASFPSDPATATPRAAARTSLAGQRRGNAGPRGPTTRRARPRGSRASRERRAVSKSTPRDVLRSDKSARARRRLLQSRRGRKRNAAHERRPRTGERER